MMDRKKLYDAFSHCAWGYLLLHFHFKLGSVDILPDFAAFLLFLSAITKLQDEERELALLRPLATLLALWQGLVWVLEMFNGSLGVLRTVANIIARLANLYFHFQFLTNLATIAARYQPEDAEHDRKLLRCRTMQTVLFTVIMLLNELSALFGDAWIYVSLVIGIPYLIAGLRVMKVLFDLRRDFRTESE